MLSEDIKTVMRDRVIDTLKPENIMDLPKIEKVCINMGLGVINSKSIKRYNDVLTAIAGQRSCIIKCKKSVASFKIRQGMEIGCKVTLRSKMAYYFLEKLIYVVLPSVRDFSGYSVKSINNRGNFSFGLNDLSAFPEVNYDDLENKNVGIDVNIAIRSRSVYHSYVLLSTLGFVFHNGNLLKKHG